MHQFKCKKHPGGLLPVDASKLNLWNKLMNHYQQSGEIVTVTLEVKSKVINQNQEGLYKAFVVKSADHFGNTYQEMDQLLWKFYPYDSGGLTKLPSRWTSEELDTFINKASAHLAQFGFHFK